MRVVSLEEELRTSEEMVRTLQNTSQQFGGSAPCGRVEEGIGEEEKMEVMARVVSEAAIAKGKTTEHQATAQVFALPSQAPLTIFLSSQGKWRYFRAPWRKQGDRSRPYKVGGDCGDSILSSMLPLNLMSVILM